MTERASSVPVAAGALPLAGHAIAMMRDPLAFLKTLPRQGKLVKVRLGSADMSMVCDRELIREVLAKDAVFDKEGPLWARLRDFMGPTGLVACPHNIHRRLRRLVQPAFHRSRMENYAGLMTRPIDTAIGAWRDGQVVDVPGEMFALTLSALIDTMFTDSIPRDEQHRLYEDAKTLLEGAFARMVLPPIFSRLPLPTNRRYWEANDRVHQLVDELVTARVNDDADHSDLLDILLRPDVDSAAEECPKVGGGPATAVRSPNRLTNDEIVDQIVMFLFAGTETTASLLSWALYLVSRSPDVERRLREEVESVLGESDAATYEHLPKLQLVDRVITETLRMYPPAWLVTRVVSEDTELGGYFLPKDTVMLLSTYLVHHRGDYFPDSEVFDPDRWLANRVDDVPKGALIPFGGGARKCPGDTFGVIEATLTLATIMARWRLEPVNSNPVRPAASSALYPKHFHLRASRRTESVV